MTDILDTMTKEQELATYRGPDRTEKLRAVLEEYQRTAPEQIHFKTGLPSLDREIGGFFSGQLVAVSGQTGGGKTTLCQTFSRHLAAQGAFPLWFSYEVAIDDFARAFDPDYHSDLILPLILKDSSFEWIEERVIEAKLKWGTKVVLIDHIHYLIPLVARGSNVSLVIGEITRKLKRMAVEHRLVIFLMCHTLKTRHDEEPGLGSIRDSSFIEQESDCVLYVYRWAEDRNVTVLKIAKNRKRGKIDARIPLVLGRDGYYERVPDDR